jgi:hypothetical protein
MAISQTAGIRELSRAHPMARPNKVYLGDRLVDLPHPFEEDVQFLVKTTYDLLCENIAHREEEGITEAEKIEDPHDAGTEVQWVESNADELRQEARSVAVVTLVTRFQHWLRIFVEDMKEKPVNGVEKNLATLNKGLGEGPVPADFFCDLETVRDSIIHADSSVEWMRGSKQRRVPLKYREVSVEGLSKFKLTEEQLREIRENAMAQINLTDEHIQEAMAKSKQQIKWYEDRLRELEMLKNAQKE